jgi:glycerophosphoryl diester phosphodiesterase
MRNFVAAHRGASRLAPENTLAAFARALSVGARAVELDVRLTSDEQVAVMHDADVDRTTDGTGPVSSMSSSEIKGLDAGSWFGPGFPGEKVPFLGEVLALTEGKARLNVELKGGPADLLAARVVDEVSRCHATERVLAMSFDLGSAIAARRAGGGTLPALAIVSGPLDDQLEFVRSHGLSGLNQAPQHWSVGTISAFHAHGLLVHGSLINDPVVLAGFFAVGGDSADSDEPACFGAGEGQGVDLVINRN